MKEIKVTVLNSSTLQLQEDAQKGDIIDLSKMSEINPLFISNLIDKEKNEEMEKRITKEREQWIKQYDAELQRELSEQKSTLIQSHQKSLDDLREEIAKLKGDLKDKENDKNLREQELANSYTGQIDKLKESLKNLQETNQKDLKSQKETLDLQYKNEIDGLRHQLDTLNFEKESEKKEAVQQKEKEFASQIEDLKKQLAVKENEIQNSKQLIQNEAEKKYETQVTELKTEIQVAESNHKTALLQKEADANKEIDKYKEEAMNWKNQYETLSRNKSSLNVKLLGENLEAWCDNEFKTAHSYGAFEHCTWEKDNTLVKNEGETGNGTKADYIFKVYSSDDHVKSPLTSACLDMKNENPASTSKKKNSDYYKRLDENRTKKKCEYAILVSELEMKAENDVPIQRVTEFPNMYVVRPSYFMTFLGILMNLGKKYADLLEQKEREDEKFKTGNEIQKEFDDFKKTYLDNPLNTLKENVSQIRKSAAKILEEGKKIDETAENIINSTLETMKQKIETLTIKKLPKLEKRIDALKEN